MDIGLGSCFWHIGHRILRVSQYRSHRSCWYGTSPYDHTNAATGTGSGGMADRERIRSIRNRCPVRKNSDERAFERVIGLHYRGEGGLKTLPLPAQHMVMLVE